jgi:outer membrane protein TolC
MIPRALCGTGASVTMLAVASALWGAPNGIQAQTLSLRDAARLALQSHPAPSAAGARTMAAAADESAVHAAYLPSVSGTIGLTRFEEPMVVAPLHGFDPSHPPDFDRTLVQSQLGVEYTLFEGGGRSARARGAGSRTAASVLREESTRMALIQAVARAYLGVLSAREVRAAARRQVEAVESESDRARQRLDEGVAARVEVLRADAAELDARADLATADANADLAVRTLARLLGIDADSLARRSLEDVAPASALPTPANAEDPRVRAARSAVDAARARTDQERSVRFPTLRATTGLLNYGSWSGAFVTEWQAGIRLSWPIFTGGARSAAIDRAQAELRAAEEDLRIAELDAEGAVDQAQAQLSAAVARTRALSASVNQWEEVTRIEALSLETGAGAQQDYLRAVAALFQARAGHAQARYDQVLALVAEARARGILEPEWLDAALENVQ